MPMRFCLRLRTVENGGDWGSLGRRHARLREWLRARGVSAEGPEECAEVRPTRAMTPTFGRGVISADEGQGPAAAPMHAELLRQPGGFEGLLLVTEYLARR